MNLREFDGRSGGCGGTLCPNALLRQLDVLDCTEEQRPAHRRPHACRHQHQRQPPLEGPVPGSFSAFTAAQASSEDVYALFATFVAKEYVTGRAGAFLSPDVAVNYLRTFVQIGKSIFGEVSDQTRYFFTCVDQHANNPKAAWLRGLIKNVHRCMCQRVCRAADEAQSCRYLLVAWPVTSTRSTAHMRSADRRRRRMR